MAFRSPRPVARTSHGSPRKGRRSLIVAMATLAVIASLLPLAPAAVAAGNQGVHLDGSNDYVTMGASPGLRSSAFTVELWFRKTGPGVGATTGTGGIASAIPLISKGTADGETAAQDINYLLGIDATSNKLVADFEEAQTGTSPSLNHPITGNTVITDNVWHHAAATYDGTTWRLYLDGAADGSLAVGQPANTAVTSATAVGTGIKTSGVTAGFFQGDVDEARVWNSARSQALIQGAMNTEVGATSGLLGVWHMNEGSGTTTTDSGGGGNTGTLTNGPTWVAGAPALDPVTPPSGTNNGVQLDGVDDAINLGAGSGSPLGATNFTLELWFKRTGTGLTASTGTGGITSVVPLITKGRSEADGDTRDTNYFLGIDVTTPATPHLAADFEDRNLPSNNNNPVIGAATITMNVWHHAAATFNGSQFCLYLDGVLDGTCRATTEIPTFDSSQIPAIGTAYDSTGASAGRFAGQVDEARIWNVARSQAQIQGAMNTEITSATTGMLGRWGMNEGSGTAAANVAGTANVNGTLQGGATWVAGAPALDPVIPPSGNHRPATQRHQPVRDVRHGSRARRDQLHDSRPGSSARAPGPRSRPGQAASTRSRWSPRAGTMRTDPTWT